MRREGVDRELAEALAERHQLVGGDLLVAEDQQLVPGEPVMDRVARRVVERSGEVDARDLGGQVGADLAEGNAHRCLPDRTSRA